MDYHADVCVKDKKAVLLSLANKQQQEIISPKKYKII
jgi:hypothetical protein